MSINDPPIAPITSGECCEVGGAQIDVVQTGACRLKRVIDLPAWVSLVHANESDRVHGSLHERAVGIRYDFPPVSIATDCC
jgi:hypothetical protein